LFLNFFGFIAFSGVFQRWELKNTTKKRKKNRVEKFLQKIDQKSKTDFSRLFLSRFWAFLGEGSSKTRKKNIEKNKSDPVPFSYSDPPTHHGGYRIVLPAPWGNAMGMGNGDMGTPLVQLSAIARDPVRLRGAGAEAVPHNNLLGPGPVSRYSPGAIIV
jgi:hypothetical protein